MPDNGYVILEDSTHGYVIYRVTGLTGDEFNCWSKRLSMPTIELTLAFTGDTLEHVARLLAEETPQHGN